MIPAQLNHYRILEPLGKGGMAEVFVAEDTRLQRKVALKVLSGLMAGDPERRTRFEREARAVAALNHPNIVTIHSVEEADGVAFLTMELIDGVPLSSLLSASGLPIETLLRIALGISDAMSAAHQRGITHRDLKPGNVMVTPDGRVKVLDFGLAKLAEPAFDGDGVTHAASKDLTGEGRIIGTVAYMSPEQAEGKTIDQRSDIFSLGVMLHEMATGERPFKGDSTISVMSSILRDTPSSITDLNPKMPAGLARIIRRALAKDPMRRYQTATDLRNDLEDLKQEIASGATVPAVPSPSSTAVPPHRRWPLAVWLWSAAAVMAMAGLAYGIWKWRGPSVPPPSAAFELDRFNRLTDAGNAQLAAIAPDGRYIVHVKIIGGKAGLWVRQTATTSDVQIVAPDDVRYDGLTFSPDGNFVYYTMYGRPGGTASLFRIPALGGPAQRIVEDIDSRVTFSPDATRIAFVRGVPAEGRAHLMVADVDGGNIRQLSSMADADQFQLNAPAWSPDGKTILIGTQKLKGTPYHSVAAVTVASGAATLIGGGWAFTRDLDWMPDGRSFVMSATDFSGTSAQVWQVMFPSGERRRITNDLNTYFGVSVSADGSSIATVQVETPSTLWVVDAKDPAKATQVTSGPKIMDGVFGVSWVAGNRLVYLSNASGRPEIWTVDADGRNRRTITNETLPPLYSAASPDGRFAVFQAPSTKGMFLKRIGLDGMNLQTLTQAGSEYFPVVSPDSRWVYYGSPASGQYRPFKVSIDGGESVALSDTNFRPTSVSPDGTTLLGVGWNYDARRSAYATLPVTGGKPVVLPGIVEGGPRWSPDGKGITFPATRSGVSNIFATSPDGKERQITRFTTDIIYNFGWSPDGTRLAVARGASSADVVLLVRAAAPGTVPR